MCASDAIITEAYDVCVGVVGGECFGASKWAETRRT